MRHPLSLYGESLLRLDGTLQVRMADGTSAPLALERYLQTADELDESLLRDVAGPVLDVGCGPGRHLHALARRGIFAMGIDVSEAAVSIARRRGVFAVVGSVFDELPGDFRWRTALLIDGNVGIGGSPVCLLSRLRSLLTEDGIVIVELDGGPVRSGPVRARLESRGAVSGWFDWARVTRQDVEGVAGAAGLAVESVWGVGDRWFARLAVA